MEIISVAKKPLTVSLAAIRITFGIFMLIWALDKFINPAHATAIWDNFYHLPLKGYWIFVTALGQTLLALAVIVGFLKRWSYGLAFLLHLISTLSTWKQLLDPWGFQSGSPTVALFQAAVPVVAASLAIYLLREYDTWTFDNWLKHGKF